MYDELKKQIVSQEIIKDNPFNFLKKLSAFCSEDNYEKNLEN